MSDKEKRILAVFGKVIPKLSEKEKDTLLAFGEGMAFKAEQQKRESYQVTSGTTNKAVV